VLSKEALPPGLNLRAVLPLFTEVPRRVILGSSCV
jgi:hypothetical protein